MSLLCARCSLEYMYFDLGLQVIFDIRRAVFVAVCSAYTSIVVCMKVTGILPNFQSALLCVVCVYERTRAHTCTGVVRTALAAVPRRISRKDEHSS